MSKSTTSWTNADNIEPGSTQTTNVEIDATLGGAFPDTVNDDTALIDDEHLTHVASAHYMIHSNIKYWNSATINWTLTNTSSTFKARCADMAISSFYETDLTPTAYIIICPFEGK